MHHFDTSSINVPLLNSGCVREAKAEVTNLPGLVIGPPTEFVHPALPLKVMDG